MRFFKVNRMLFGSLFVAMAFVSRWFSISYMIGSQTGFFSASSIISPLAGTFLGIGNSVVVLFLVALCKGSMSAFGGSLLLGCAQWLPGVVASCYWRTRSYLFGLVLPVVCMGLFLAHPVGLQSWGYTLLWLIPVVFHRYRSHIYCRSLASTFVAHAVGSVLWIYGRPMVSAVWWGLIPLALVERVVVAVGIVAVYTVLCSVRRIMSAEHLYSHVRRTVNK